MSPTDLLEVLQIITKMKNKQSNEIDSISASLIKKTPSIVAPLSQLIYKSLEEGIMQDLLKIAKFQPIYNGNDKDLLNNYRPISILPTIS